MKEETTAALARQYGEINEAFERLYRREMTFEQFERETRPLWRRMAAQIHRRWRAPAWHSREDTEQDLLLAAWDFIGSTWNKFDEERGPTARGYAVYNAYDKAKKTLHKNRGANRHGNADSASGVIPKPFSSFSRDGEDEEYADVEARLTSRPGAQESRLLVREDRAEFAVRALLVCETLEEYEAIHAVVEAAQKGVSGRAVGQLAGRALRRVAGRIELGAGAEPAG